MTAAPVQTPTAVSRPDTQATTEPVSTATPAPAATPVPGNVLGSTIIVGNHALVMVHPGEEKYSRGIRNRKRDRRPVKNRISQLRQKTARFRNGCIIVTSLSAQLRSRKVLQRSDVCFSRSSLRTVTIPEGVTTIDYAAFYHCDNLDNVILPDTVNTVGAKAFTHTGWMDDLKRTVWMIF